MKYLFIILKNVGRNPLRTVLTTLGTMVLVVVVTLVWSILAFLDQETAEKSHNLRAIVTERWKVPSQMPRAYAATLAEGAARNPGDVKPLDWMSWQFYVGTLDPANNTRENLVFAVATQPEKIMTMMPELDSLSPAESADLAQSVKRLQARPQGMIVGRDRLQAIGRRMGDRLKVYGMNFKGIDLEFEVVGVFPPGRYDNSALMNTDYLQQALDAFGRNGQKHPMADKSLNLVWLRVADKEMFARVSQQIMNSPYYTAPALKCETESSGVAEFLEAFHDIIWGMRWLLAPATLATLSLVIANAISISVRQRRTELAVLKVLGFRPRQVLLLVLGEALLIGTLAGLGSALCTLVVINNVLGGLKFPIAFFSSFYIPSNALWWGAGMGAGTALAGAILPAWTAQSVKAAEVFAKVG